MMNLLSVIAGKDADKLQEKVQRHIVCFEKRGIAIEEKLNRIDNFYSLQYNVEINNIKEDWISKFINVFKYCIAEGIVEYIEECEQPKLILKAISSEYYYFNIEEQKEIYDKVIRILKIGEENVVPLEEVQKQRTMLLEQLTKYLSHNSFIHIEGFVLFRLKNYLLYLQEVIERVVEDFLMDKEYNEFIKLLKYFVDIQEPKVSIVHVVLDEECRYKLYDQNGKIINNEYLKTVATEMNEKDVNYEDLLISTLITIAPSKIFLHKVSSLKNTDVVKMIDRIFLDKVKTCNGCDWCTVKVKVKKESNKP